MIDVIMEVAEEEGDLKKNISIDIKKSKYKLLPVVSNIHVARTCDVSKSLMSY